MQHIILLDDYVLLDYFEIKLIKKHVKYIMYIRYDHRYLDNFVVDSLLIRFVNKVKLLSKF